MTDTVDANTGTTGVLDNFTAVRGRVETTGDKDWYKVELVLGKTYVFTVEQPAGTTDYVDDCFIQLRDDTGAVIVNNPAGQVETAKITYTANRTGSFYVAAGADAGVGGFTVSMLEKIPDTPASPLPLVPTIDWESKLASTTVKVYFGEEGEAIGEWSSLAWTEYEIGQVLKVFDTFAAVSALRFVRVFNKAEANITLAVQVNDPTDEQYGSTLGQCNPPGEIFQGAGIFYRAGSGWDTTGGLEPGGNGWNTLIHELGHAVGLKHPHDSGGRGGPVLTGTSETDPFDTYGAFNLNQGVNTVMSYVVGWATGPTPLPAGANYGQAASLMAIDIAALQFKYGANTAAGAGDTLYALPAANEVGVAVYKGIWDVGGTDTIAASGTANAVINLTAATIDYTATGGGVVSYIGGIHGGFTIARGVVIENATGAGGHDTLTGNAAVNALNGGAGNDKLYGLGGSDTLDGGAGDDTLEGGTGNDTFVVDSFDDQVIEKAGGGTDTVQTALHNYMLPAYVERLELLGTANLSGQGNSSANTLIGNAGNNRLNGGAGADVLEGGLGNDTYVLGVGDVINERAGEGADWVETTFTYTVGANLENAKLTGGAVASLTGNGVGNVLKGNATANTLKGEGGADTLEGAAGNDVLEGGEGNDSLNGGTGDDDLTGGGGADVFRFLSTADGLDLIFDFARAEGDKINVSVIDADETAAGNQAFRWMGAAAFSGAGQLRVTADPQGGWLVELNTDADAEAELAIIVDASETLGAIDFVL